MRETHRAVRAARLGPAQGVQKQQLAVELVPRARPALLERPRASGAHVELAVNSCRGLACPSAVGRAQPFQYGATALLPRRQKSPKFLDCWQAAAAHATGLIGEGKFSCIFISIIWSLRRMGQLLGHQTA